MVHRRLLLIVVAAIGASFPTSGIATAIANSTLSFFNLSITPTLGSLSLDDNWLMTAFASANNSRGETDSQLGLALSPGAAAANASVTWAAASGAASAPNDPPDLLVSGTAASSVQIPGCDRGAAFSEGHGTLSNLFTVSGTGMVAVEFAIDLTGSLNVFTDACGVSAATDTIFKLEVDGQQVLFDHRMFAIGPSDQDGDSFATHLTGTIFLLAGVSHFLIMQADSESRAQNPEPASITLLLLALSVLLWSRQSTSVARRRNGRQAALHDSAI